MEFENQKIAEFNEFLQTKKIAILGECKFKSEKFDNKDLENFLKKVKLVKAENAFLCVFSLSGFTDYVKNNNKNILLVSIDNMYWLNYDGLT